MPYNFEKLSVLVVEDNPPMCNLVASMFEVFGCLKIDQAYEGRSAFDLFCKHDHDLIITDVRMNPVGGMELLDMVRTDTHSPNRYVPCLIMSGLGQKEHVLEARDKGMTEFIVKPFLVDDLYKRVVEIIERPRQFIKIDGYFGPDRRRKKLENYKGPFRRATDIRPEDYKKERDYDDMDIAFKDVH